MLIFAIDDERPLLNAAERVISAAAPEAKIMAFSDPNDAIAEAERGNRPDVVFSDIEMPGISGLELAVKLKIVAPGARIVFVTGYSKYAMDAFRVRAQGYLMKPLTAEMVREELDAIPALQAPASDKLQVRCFGHFEVFWKGQPLLFQRRQTRELLAFLIDREGKGCTAEEIASALWENENDLRAARQRIRNLINDLKNTFRSIGMEGILIRNHKQIAIRQDMVDCDYYRMLNGDVAEINAFRGEYMIDYSWAELTAGKLFFSNEQT